MINRSIISVETKDRPRDRRFHLREFRRMIAFVWPHKKPLLIGIVLTIVFAGMHTISLAGVFPIFQVLLGHEGLRTWADRTVAEDRLGLTLATTEDGTAVRVLKVHGRAAELAPEIHEGDLLRDPQGQPVAPWLSAVARAGHDASSPVQVERGPERISQEIRPGNLDWRHRLLRAVSGLVPASANTHAGKISLLVWILVLVVLLVAAANLCRYWGEVLVARAVLQGLIGLRVKLYERTLQLPMAFFAAQPTADIVTRFVQDVQEIQRGLLTLFGKFIREPLKAILILGLALLSDWRLTLTLVVAAPVTVAIFWAVGRSVKKANRKLLEQYGGMIDALTTSLQNLRVVKAYTAEEQERERLRAVDQRMFVHQLKLARLEALISPAVETLAVLAGSILTLWLASRVIQQELDLPKFLWLGVVLSMLFDPLRKMTDVYVRIQRATAGAERIFHVIDQPIEVQPQDDGAALAPLARAIEFVGVTFTYPNAERPALRGVTTTIRKGETVAIVGPNGSGKTTLVSLLLRFFDPDSGQVFYDGRDLRTIGLKSLRRQFGLVTQDAIIFAGTPIENIVYGSPGRNGEAAQGAARRAFADEFIRQIPGGYEARLGERGTTLSGGQRQRLAIARAIYRDAPILIFDEATSQIDSESELKIQQALREFAQGRTTIIIAHRLSTIQFAHRIIVMDSGCVIDDGAHKELIERCPLYRTLCETQLAELGAAV